MIVYVFSREDPPCKETNRTQAKNWEYPLACTPIIFKGFSEKAKRRILEAVLEPQKRTLGAIDVSLEDGVTFFTEVRLIYSESCSLTRVISLLISSSSEPKRKMRGTFGMLRMRIHCQVLQQCATLALLFRHAADTNVYNFAFYLKDQGPAEDADCEGETERVVPALQSVTAVSRRHLPCYLRP